MPTYCHCSKPHFDDEQIQLNIAATEASFYQQRQWAIICQCCGKAVQLDKKHGPQNVTTTTKSQLDREKILTILLKPSFSGNDRYVIGDDLHIGISIGPANINAKPILVTSFCRAGIVNEFFEPIWNGAIVLLKIPLANPNVFDKFIRANGKQFDAKAYSSTDWNCFDFVLEFLHQNLPSFKCVTKEQFVIKYILPSIKPEILNARRQNEY